MAESSYVSVAIAFSVFLCAVFASVGARQKGRSELGWFIVGLTCAPFALLVYAMPSLLPIKGRGAQKQPDLKIQKGMPIWVFFAFIVLGALAVITFQGPSIDGKIADLANFIAGGIDFIMKINPFKLV
jgi:hypothetical protein